MNVFPFIAAEKAGEHNVKRACELLEVSKSAYCQHARGHQPTRKRVDQQLSNDRLFGYGWDGSETPRGPQRSGHRFGREMPANPAHHTGQGPSLG